MSARRLRASRDNLAAELRKHRHTAAASLQVLTPDPTVLATVRRYCAGDLRRVEWITPERAVVHNDSTWRRR